MLRNNHLQDMSVNSSSTNGSLPLVLHCLFTSPSSLVFATLNITSILLLLPLCILILYHGLQQWRSSSLAATMSHSDSITYHMVTMELIGFFGSILCCVVIFTENLEMLDVGTNFLTFTWFGEIFFHILTCVERYLAVVHPITYMSLRKARGVRIRNISIGCVWLLCFAEIGFTSLDDFIIVYFFNLISSLTVISFCSLSVLRVLIRSGPGEQVGRRERVDQSKLRAFYTIVVILGVLLLRVTWCIIWALLFVSGISKDCVIMASEGLLNIPSILVLPLLFLHRTGKCVCCKNNLS